MQTVKIYNDLQPLYFENYEDCLNEYDLVASSHSNSLDLINEYATDSTINKWDYGTPGKKVYRNRMGNTLDVLLPMNLGDDKIEMFAIQFMNTLLAGQYFIWICEKYKKGNAAYLKYTVISSKKYTIPKEVYSKRQSDGFRNSKTGRLCSANHPDAVVAYKKGDKYGVKQLNWSLKKRFFEMTSSQFAEFKANVEKAFILTIQSLIKGVNVITHHFKQKKFKIVGRLNSWENINFNRNIWIYNLEIDRMNRMIDELDRIIYSPAGYYQDSELKQVYENLYYSFRQRLKSGKFRPSKKRKLTISINPLIPTRIFRENIELLSALFEDEINVFISKYISIV